MKANTGAWAALPDDTPWATTGGTSFRALGARAEAILTRMEQGISSGVIRSVELTDLAVHVGELCAVLGHLATQELPVEALIAFGQAIERGRRRHLHLL